MLQLLVEYLPGVRWLLHNAFESLLEVLGAGQLM
jgi:hypothetical protein